MVDATSEEELARRANKRTNRDYELELERKSKYRISKLEEAISNMHKEHPDAIFLTQTSSVPFGWAIKEAWKKAYPGEKIPVMLTIDVGQLKYGSKEVYRQMNVYKAQEMLYKDPEFDREVKSIEEKIKQYHIKKAVVFDESYDPSGGTAESKPESIVTKQTPFLVNEVLSKAKKYLKKSFEKDVKIYGISEWDRLHYFIPHRQLEGHTRKQL